MCLSSFESSDYWYCIRPWFLISDAKRLIGRKFNDTTVQSDMKHWSFDVVDESTKPKVKVEYKVS